MYLLDAMSGYGVFQNFLTNVHTLKRMMGDLQNKKNKKKTSVGQKPFKSTLIWTLSTGGKLHV